jgi:predicted RNA methylase
MNVAAEVYATDGDTETLELLKENVEVRYQKLHTTHAIEYNVLNVDLISEHGE